MVNPDYVNLCLGFDYTDFLLIIGNLPFLYRIPTIAIIMMIAIIPPIGESPSSLSSIDSTETSIVVSYDMISNSQIESLYLTSNVIS